MDFAKLFYVDGMIAVTTLALPTLLVAMTVVTHRFYGAR